MTTYPALGVVLTLTFLSSLDTEPPNAIIDAVEYERIPPNMRGRMFGVITARAWEAVPVGTLLGSVLTEQIGVQLMLTLLGATYLLTTLSMAVIPVMRQMNRHADTKAAIYQA